MQNPSIPASVEVVKIVTEVDTKDIKTFLFAFQNKDEPAAWAKRDDINLNVTVDKGCRQTIGWMIPFWMTEAVNSSRASGSRYFGVASGRVEARPAGRSGVDSGHTSP